MKVRTASVAVLAAVCVGLLVQSASAQSNLFSQYYTQPGASQTSAGMYPAPHYVPSNVGASYYTYEPLQPHEMMHAHSRNYYNYYAGPESFYSNQCNGRGGGGALTRTTVRWQSGANHMGPLPLSISPFANAQYAMQRYWYCIQRGGKGCSGLLRGHVSGKLSRVRGAVGSLGHRHGGGCASGDCGESYGDEYYGDYGGEVQQGGCASGACHANLSDESLKR